MASAREQLSNIARQAAIAAGNVELFDAKSSLAKTTTAAKTGETKVYQSLPQTATQTSTTGGTGADAITQAMEQRNAALNARAQTLNQLQAELNARYAAAQSGQSSESMEQLILEQDRLNDRRQNLERDSAQYGVDAAYYDTILASAPYIAAERAVEESGTQVSGGTQDIINTMRQRVDQIDQRRKELADQQAALTERARLLQYSGLTGAELDAEKTAINEAVADLTQRQQQLMKDAGVYSEEARTYDDNLIARAEQDMMDFAERQMDAYYDETAMAEVYEGQKAALYAEWQALNQQELQTGIYGDRTASQVWSDIKNLEGSYQRQLMEADEYWTAKQLRELSDGDLKNLDTILQSEFGETAIGRMQPGKGKNEKVSKAYRELYEKYSYQDVEAYLQIRRRQENAENSAIMQETIKQMTIEKPVAANVAVALTRIPATIGAAAEFASQIVNNPAGYQTLDVNGAGNVLQSAGRTVQQTTTEQIKANLGKFWGNVASGAYQLGMSTVDSLVAMGTGTGLLLAANAATNTMQDITERGGTVGQAIVGGVLAGAAEAVFEKFSIEKWEKLTQKDVVRTVRDWVSNTAKSIATNASEEMATEFANIVTDSIVMGGFSNYADAVREMMRDNPNLSEAEAQMHVAVQMGLDVLKSGASGAIMGGFFGVLGSRTAYKRTKLRDGMVSGAIAQGLGYEGSEAFKIAAGLQVKLNEGLEVTDEELSGLIEANQSQADQREAAGANEEQAAAAASAEEAMGLPAVMEQIAQEMPEARTESIQKEQEQQTAMQKEVPQEAVAPSVQQAERSEETSGNNPARGVEKNTAQVNTEENALRREAESVVRNVQETVPEALQEARLTAEIEDLKQSGLAPLAEEIKTVWNEVGGENVVALKDEPKKESVAYGREEASSDGVGERDAGTYTGGSSGVLGSRSESGKRRNVQNRRAAERQNRVADFRIQKVSTRSLGIEIGSDVESVTVIPEELWDDEMQNTAVRVWEEQGLEVEFILGRLRLGTIEGTKYAKGAIVGNKILIQADNARYTIDQIADHEGFHNVAKNSAGTVSEIEEKIRENYSEEEFREVVDKYMKAYAGVYDNDDELMQKILEEIFADAYAGINQFSPKVETYRGVARKTVERRTGKRALGERGVQETRAGPEDTKNAPADAETERYSIAGERAETADRKALENAKLLMEAGVNPEEVFSKTGWFIGRDGKWRFEIDDSTARIDESGEARFKRENPEYGRYLELMDKVLTGWPSREEFEEIKRIEKDNPGIANMRNVLRYQLEQGMATLGDFMEHDDLYRAYPAIANTKVVLSSDMSSGKVGAYNPKTDTLTLNAKMKNDPDKLIGVLLHEVQHRIQTLEGFASGSNVNYWNREETYERGIQVFKDNRQRLLYRMSDADRNMYEEYREIDRKQEEMLDDLLNLDLDEMDRLEKRSDELYAELRKKEWFDNMWLYDRVLDNAKEAVEAMYFYTAGEIEARDVTSRHKMSGEERRSRMPDLGDENTVFAEGSNENAEIEVIDGELIPVVDTKIDTRSYDAAEAYIKALIDSKNPFAKILQDALDVYIGSDLPGEYRSSEYTKNMGSQDKTRKMQAATNLDEMLLIAENGKWIENFKEKHKKDAKYGWYRYETKFAIPIKTTGNGETVVAVYDATLVIRNDEDGKSYLYDLINIRKRKTVAAQLHTSQSRELQYMGRSGLSSDSVTQDREEVNIKNETETRFSIDADTGSPAAEAQAIWEEMRNTYGDRATMDAAVNGRIYDLRESGEMETADSLERIWRQDAETVAPPTGYDDRGERWNGEVTITRDAVVQDTVERLAYWATGGSPESVGEARENGNREERVEELMAKARAAREETLRLIPREEFKATEAIDKLGVKIEGSVANYENANQLRQNDAAAKEILRDVKKAEKGATAKEKAFASAIAAGIYDPEDIPNTLRTERVAELADRYSDARAMGLDMIRERKRDINGQLDDKMKDLFREPEKYKAVSAMTLYHNTPERAMRKIFGDKLGAKVAEEIFRPVERNEAERLRFINRQFDRVRTFKDSKGKLKELNTMESALTQQIIEGRAVAQQVAAHQMKGAIEDAAKQLRNGGVIGEVMEKLGLNTNTGKLAEKYARWLDAQEAMKSGKVDAVKVENAADEYRKIFDEYYDAINDFLVVHGYQPIGFIKGYAPHMQSDQNKEMLEKALNALGIQTGVSALPTNIAGLTSEFKPGKRWNPYFLTRNTDQTDFDIMSAFESYVSYMSDVLYHTDDIMRVRRMSAFFRKSYSPDEIRANIDWAETLRYATIEEKEEFLRDMKVLDYGSALSPEEVEQKMEAFIEGEFAKIGDKTKFGNLVSWLDNYANILAGKQSVADRGFEAEYGRKILNFGLKVTKTFSRANVAGNISSSLNQLAQLPQVVAENGNYNTLRAAVDIVSGKLRKAKWSEQSDFLTGKKGIDFLVNKPGDMIVSAIFKTSEFTDGLLSTLAVRGAYYKAIRKGMTNQEAMRAADKYGREVMGSRIKGVKPTAFESKNPLSQMVNMFQVEVLNSWQHLSKDLPRDFREIAETKSRGKAALALSGVVVKTILGAFLMNRMTDELYGGTPAPFDLVGMSMNFIASGEGLVVNDLLMMLIDNVWEELFGERPFETEKRDPDEEQEFDWKAAAEDVWYEISNEIPYWSNVSALLGWGDQTLPMPNVVEKIKNLFTTAKNAGVISPEMAEALIEMAGEFAPGGRQLTKTAKGVRIMLEGGKYSGYGENRKLQYPVSDTWDNWAKAALFGYSSLKETDRFYASGVGGLSAKQTEVYDKLIGQGYESGILYETLQAYKAAEDAKGERDAITNADLTDKQKLKLYVALKGDSREEEFENLMNAGLSWAATMKAYDKYSELYNTEGMNATEKATRYAKWVDEQGYKPEQTNLIKDELKFFSMAPAEAGNYEKFSDAGLSIKESFDLASAFAELEPEEGKEQVSDIQKYRAIIESGMDEDEQLKAIGAIMGTDMLTESGEPSQYAKMLEILDDGTTITEYLDMKEKGIVEKYLEGVSVGMTKDGAVAAAEAVKSLPKKTDGKDYTQTEKQMAAVKACKDVEDQILAYAAYGDSDEEEKNIQKIRTAYKECGLTPVNYLTYRMNTAGLDAKDANGKTVTNLKKARVIMKIDEMNITKEQKNYLFESAGYKGVETALWNINRSFSSAEEYANWL